MGRDSDNLHFSKLQKTIFTITAQVEGETKIINTRIHYQNLNRLFFSSFFSSVGGGVVACWDWGGAWSVCTVCFGEGVDLLLVDWVACVVWACVVCPCVIDLVCGPSSSHMS